MPETNSRPGFFLEMCWKEGVSFEEALRKTDDVEKNDEALDRFFFRLFRVLSSESEPESMSDFLFLCFFRHFSRLFLRLRSCLLVKDASLSQTF